MVVPVISGHGSTTPIIDRSYSVFAHVMQNLTGYLFSDNSFVFIGRKCQRW